MTNKIILTSAQEKALQLVMKAWNGSIDHTIESHSKNSADIQWKGEKAPLNDLSTAQVSRALLVGYDVVDTIQVGSLVRGKCSKNIYEVTSITNSYAYLKGIICQPGKIFTGALRLSELELVEPHEVKFEKEKQMWAKMGRELGEFREKDVVINSTGIAFYVGYSNNLPDGIVEPSTAKQWYLKGQTKGVYLTESFVNFKEGMK